MPSRPPEPRQHRVADRSADIHFGKIASGTNRNYTGVLDEVAIYNTALTAITVTNHYNAR